MTRVLSVLAAVSYLALAIPAFAQDDALPEDVSAEDEAALAADDGSAPYRTALEKAARTLAAAEPGLPQEEAERIALYVLGNTINTLFHEYGHALVSELELPVVGKEEDAVDSLANIIMVEKTTDPALDQMLRAVADDYFINGDLAEENGDVAAPWDEHSPDRARAYDVICMLVGADPEFYGETADRAGMPPERQESCAGEYESRSNAWFALLEPYYLAEGQANKPVKILYGKPGRDTALIARMIKASGILKVVTDEITNMVLLPNPISAAAETCGESNAYWSPDERKLTLCYEIAQSYFDNATAQTPGLP